MLASLAVLSLVDSTKENHSVLLDQLLTVVKLELFCSVPATLVAAVSVPTVDGAVSGCVAVVVCTMSDEVV